MKNPARVVPEPSGPLFVLQKAVTVLFLLFVFLLGVKGLGDGFKFLGEDLLQAFFTATENPFIGLMIGILGTTLVQSSSVSTSMIVALVAAPENPLPVANAVPMIMGTNIGTTVTNTAVSLAHMGRREEFRRAFAVATCHDFFNFIIVAVLLPLELMTGYLRQTAESLAALVSGFGGVTYSSPLKTSLKVAFQPVVDGSKLLFETPRAQGVLIIILSGVLIVAALLLLVKVMRSAMQSRVEVFITQFLGQSAMLSILVGIIVTVMVQSSSITTSLLVPLAGAGLITLMQAFPITLGREYRHHGDGVVRLHGGFGRKRAIGRGDRPGAFPVQHYRNGHGLSHSRNSPIAAGGGLPLRGFRRPLAQVGRRLRPFLVLRPPGRLCVPRPILEVIRRVLCYRNY